VEQSVPEGEDAQNNVAKEVIKIGNNDVVIGDCFNGSVIINGSTQTQKRQQLQILSTASQRS
jgi:hypothetical protein